MRRIITSLAASAIMASGLVATAPAASADTPGCVSKREFRKIGQGWTSTRVHRVFDTLGRQTSQGYGYQSREYKTCVNPRYGFVWVDFERRNGAWYFDGKTAYWG